VKTLLDDFYDIYKNTWFRKFEPNKEKPMYYIISSKSRYGFEMIKYYPKTDKIYENRTAMTIDHFRDFEIVEEDDLEYEKLQIMLVKSLLVE